MIPQLIRLSGSPWDVLPPGIHPATVAEIEATFAYNQRRRALLKGLVDACVSLATAGCRILFLDGSYVSAKPIPGDYDACWEPDGVDFAKLDPIFGDFDDGRTRQKARFGGEFFPSTMIETSIGGIFVEFFQVDRFTGKPKGVLSVSIETDEAVMGRARQ